MLRTGAAWLTDRLADSAAVPVVYVRSGNQTQLLASVGRSMFESQGSSGVVEQWESRDFLIKTSSLPYSEPLRGDHVVETYGGVDTTYEVSAPRGVPLFHYGDAYRSIVRIHTVATANAGFTPSALLVRAVGVYAGTTITDQQIVSSLTVESSAGRSLTKTLAPATQYVYVVLPTSYGSPTLKVNGLISSAWELTTRSITFTGQAARSYNIYRSTYAVTGVVTLEVA